MQTIRSSDLCFVNQNHPTYTSMKREAEDDLGGEDKKLPPIESSLPDEDAPAEGSFYRINRLL